MAKNVPERNEISKKDTWALEDIYPNLSAWEEDLDRLKKLAEKIPEFKGKISVSPESLLAFMRLSDEISLLCDDLANYAHRKSDEDTRISENQALVSRVTAVMTELGEASDFEAPELLSISDETMEQFYARVPELKLYRRHFDRLRKKKDHVLDAAGEKLLASVGEVAASARKVYSLFSNADLTFPNVKDAAGEEHALSQGTYIMHMTSQDRVLRKNAFDTYYNVYENFKNTVAATLAGHVKSLQFYAKARNYSSPLERALSGTEVSESVYHNLIKVVNENQDKMYRYLALRKKLLGLDELHFYDLYAPLVTDADEKYSYEESVATVKKAMAPLGEDYGKHLAEGFSNRWIDVYENKGKRSGAYSAGARVHPYVLLNYTGTLDSQFTIAHEMGHAMHSWYSTKNQPVIYSDYVIFVAEVASTCNEALLMEYLLQQTTDRRKRANLINHFLEQFRATLYRQTMFAEFELKISQLEMAGIPLTAEKLCEEYEILLRKYFGDEIVIDPHIRMEWARIPHFYYNFYVYQYATGFSAAIALSRRILSGETGAVEDYLNFLSGGCSKDPISLLRDAGVDMATEQPVRAALELFGSMLDEMEKLMEDVS